MRHLFATLAVLSTLAVVGCGNGHKPCRGIAEGPAVTVERRTAGCGEPDEDELHAMFTEVDDLPCYVREAAYSDGVCALTFETECEPEPGVIWEWTGTLTFDGRDYVGILSRRYTRPGDTLCNGTFYVTVEGL